MTVIGGGVIGLATAWRASAAGYAVTVLERKTIGSGASSVAAGMLAPVTELEFGASATKLLELGMRSAAMWKDFAGELSEASGVEVPLSESGTVWVARDGDEARELERQLTLRESLGLPTKRLLGSEVRALEPAVAPAVRLGLEAPEDYSVNPRDVVAALKIACERSGVQVREGVTVAAIEHRAEGGSDAEGERDASDAKREVSGVRIADGSSVSADAVIIAAGAWSALLDGWEDGRLPVRPVKGQILRLRDPAGPGLLTRTIRYEGGYVVPRGDGRYVLGATVEEQGFNDMPTAGGVYEVLKEACETVPGVMELELVEVSVSFRPGTKDNLPIIGPSAMRGLIYATGHYRNGILLTPVTAELTLAALQETMMASAA